MRWVVDVANGGEQQRSDGDAECQMANGTEPLQVQGAEGGSGDSEDPAGRCDDRTRDGLRSAPLVFRFCEHFPPKPTEPPHPLASNSKAIADEGDYYRPQMASFPESQDSQAVRQQTIDSKLLPSNAPGAVGASFISVFAQASPYFNQQHPGLVCVFSPSLERTFNTISRHPWTPAGTFLTLPCSTRRDNGSWRDLPLLAPPPWRGSGLIQRNLDAFRDSRPRPICVVTCRTPSLTRPDDTKLSLPTAALSRIGSCLDRPWQRPSYTTIDMTP
ncbi:hypothetical protein CPLU01_11888 [Colletotrichum plurivorum]|uniref:Uncharacterized protein n=1 Tax=Colletotrichum plurivorum TaxID=2175906 RepID=A0A8H6K0F4_9PEZI|nr:hypothetical protein CPLU01_11888 [Colletotrichum plurivorum]